MKNLDQSLADAIVSGNKAQAMAFLEAGANPNAKVDLPWGLSSMADAALLDVDVFMGLMDKAGKDGLDGLFSGELLKKALAGHASMQVIRALMKAASEASLATKNDMVLEAIFQNRQDAACEMTRENWLSTNEDEQQALVDAVDQEMIPLVRMLLGKGVVPGVMWRGVSQSKSALMASLRSDGPELCEMLLNAGADPNKAGECGEGSALGVACANNNRASLDIAKALIKAGADVEARGDKGITVLMRAAGHGNEACVKLLIEAGAKKDERDERGGTALMWACARGCVSSARHLLAAGADPNARANGPKAMSPGVTAAMICCEKGHATCLSELIRAGANIKATDDAGCTVREWIEAAKIRRSSTNEKRFRECEAVALSALEGVDIGEAARFEVGNEAGLAEGTKNRLRL